MTQANIIIKAYFEALYELLDDKKELLAGNITDVLSEEIKNGGFGEFDEAKFAAYWEACLAFIEERIESYNPFGIQYVYGRGSKKEAFELELQLNWYDSRNEFEALVEAANIAAESLENEDMLAETAGKLIKEMGAFPDKSIINAYRRKPALNKLPDYVVAMLIEDIILL